MNLANAITSFRLLLIPMVVGSYYSDWVFSNVIAAVLFTLASLSDWLDGYLARRLDIATDLGGIPRSGGRQAAGFSGSDHAVNAISSSAPSGDAHRVKRNRYFCAQRVDGSKRAA